MRMTAIFTVFAAIAGASGYLLPHAFGAIGYDMLVVYAGFALVTALLTVIRR
jgi:hypothetical protein